MLKSVKHPIFFVTCLITCLSISGSLFSAATPPIIAITTLPPVNFKNVATNNPEIKASIVDLTASMKDSQCKIFQTCGLIPMLITVENKSGKAIQVAPEILDFGLGLSIDKTRDLIIKTFKLKKYGSYASIWAYRTIIATALVATAIYFPYSEVYSCSQYLIDWMMSSSTAWSAMLSILSQIPESVKFGASVMSLSLALKYLTPSMFMKMSHALIDKYYNTKSFCSEALGNIKELNQAIDFVANSDNAINLDNAINFSVAPKSSKNFMIFVKKNDAVNIKNDVTFSTLKFE